LPSSAWLRLPSITSITSITTKLEIKENAFAKQSFPTNLLPFKPYTLVTIVDIPKQGKGYNTNTEQNIPVNQTSTNQEQGIYSVHVFLPTLTVHIIIITYDKLERIGR